MPSCRTQGLCAYRETHHFEAAATCETPARCTFWPSRLFATQSPGLTSNDDVVHSRSGEHHTDLQQAGACSVSGGRMLSHRTQPVLRSIALTVDFCLKDADDETAVSTSKTSCAIVLPAVWHSPSERARHSSNSLAASAASTILFFWLGRGRQGNLRHCQSPRLPCLSRLLTSSQRIFERLHRFLDSVSAPQRRKVNHH